MNAARGFKRLGLLLVGFYYLVSGYWFYSTTDTNMSHRTDELVGCVVRSQAQAPSIIGQQFTPQQCAEIYRPVVFWFGIVILWAFPVLLYCGSRIAVWIWRGFRHDPEKSN
jgi:hypothetical protein